MSRISRAAESRVAGCVEVWMLTGPLISNTSRSPSLGSLPARRSVMLPAASGSRAFSEDLATSSTTRLGLSSWKALCLTAADNSSTTRVPLSEGAMRMSRISAAMRGEEAPATDASSVNQTAIRFPRKPSPSWSSTPELSRNLLIRRKSFNALNEMTLRLDRKPIFEVRYWQPARGTLWPFDQPQESGLVVVGKAEIFELARVIQAVQVEVDDLNARQLVGLEQV